MLCRVLDEVVCCFLVAHLAVKGVDPPFVVGASAPEGRIRAEFGDGQDKLVSEGKVEDWVGKSMVGVAA